MAITIVTYVTALMKTPQSWSVPANCFVTRRDNPGAKGRGKGCAAAIRMDSRADKLARTDQQEIEYDNDWKDEQDRCPMWDHYETDHTHSDDPGDGGKDQLAYRLCVLSKPTGRNMLVSAPQVANLFSFIFLGPLTNSQ